MRQAWRRGRASRLCGEGSSRVEVEVVVVVGGGGYDRVGERVRDSVRSRDWSEGRWEISWKR